jgi:hypothetical protein
MSDQGDTVFEEEIQQVVEWITNYGIGDCVGSGYEDQLKGIAENLIWTEYMSGVEGDFVFNGYEPANTEEGWVPQGYYVGSTPWTGEAKSLFITTFIYESCECDGEDEDCDECDGEGSQEHDLVESARVRIAAPGAKPGMSIGLTPNRPKFCQECGSGITLAAKFCAECGMKIST